MARNYKLKLSGIVAASPVVIWFTIDGSENGRVCRSRIPDLDNILAFTTATQTIGNAGNPFNEKPLTDGGGRPFDINFENVPVDRWDDLSELIAAAMADESELNFVGTGAETADFDIDFIPRYDGNVQPLTHEKFSIGYIKGVTIRGTTTAIN